MSTSVELLKFGEKEIEIGIVDDVEAGFNLGLEWERIDDDVADGGLSADAERAIGTVRADGTDEMLDGGQAVDVLIDVEFLPVVNQKVEEFELSTADFEVESFTKALAAKLKHGITSFPCGRKLDVMDCSRNP